MFVKFGLICLGEFAFVRARSHRIVCFYQRNAFISGTLSTRGIGSNLASRNRDLFSRLREKHLPSPSVQSVKRESFPRSVSKQRPDPGREMKQKLSARAPHVANFLISDMFNGSLLPLLVNYTYLVNYYMIKILTHA